MCQKNVVGKLQINMNYVLKWRYYEKKSIKKYYVASYSVYISVK